MKVVHGKTDDKGRWHCQCHLLESDVTSTWRTARAQLAVSWRGMVGDSISQAPLEHCDCVSFFKSLITLGSSIAFLNSRLSDQTSS